jgi:sugar-specific transcriptional regulator TrmB
MEEEIQALTKLGLTKAQAKVYHALLTFRKEANASTLWKASQLARQDIYRILSELQQMGLIEKILSTPTTYRSAEVETNILNLIERKNLEISAMAQEAQNLIQKFKTIEQTEITEDQWILIPEGVTIRGRLKRAFKNSRKSIEIISSRKPFFQAVITNSKEFGEALKHGSKVRWIIEGNAEEGSQPQEVGALVKDPNFLLRTISNCAQIRSVEIDEKEVFIRTNLNTSFGESPALWSNNPCMIRIVQKCFETIWANARKEKAKSP